MGDALHLVGGTDLLRSLGAEELAERLGGALDALRVAEEAAGDYATKLKIGQ